ncbi:acid phosphatase precursor [Didymella exigua CBS 183.55]|uniref:Acid phosphatase n=1 Tax=Didymella exigua CBS 183.55 TaxID=1150837 RepID=A0A6A5RNP0_9PLEO|nr:acid phosphatase precursor [Didymella exigua CBS 183.55]KAF1929995.1 acid phosphatase precursor [Didymella exigua CBS 183.55]
MRCSLLVATILPLAQGIRIIQSNDDGWAEINIRTFFNTLNAAGHQVVLSSPAENQSGSGSSDATPETVNSDGCEFSSCPGGSPATGANATDRRLNYVNSYPVTAIKTGISTSAPKLWNGAAPELALTGPNVGSNVDVQVPFSGTVGAAVYAAKTAKIPAIAFSGSSGNPTAWNQPTPLYSSVYADLALNITSTIISSGKPYLPDNTWLNVNFPAVSSTKCNNVNQFKFIFTRIHSGLIGSAADITVCGTTARLPWEADVAVLRASDCYVSISPGDANDKTTAPAAQQQIIYDKLKPILSCLS